LPPTPTFLLEASVERKYWPNYSVYQGALVLRAALAHCRRAFTFAALFSFIINLLLLVMSVYMMQLYDRVLTTNSTDTLLYLTLIALAALLTLALVDAARARLLVTVSTYLDEAIAPAALERSLSNSLRRRTYRSEALRDLTEVRNFLTGPGILALLDLPWAPLFLVIIFLLHPMLGVVAGFAAVLLFALAFLNDWTVGRRLRSANDINVQAFRDLEIYNANAEIVDALGMMSAVANRWLNLYGEGLQLQGRASNTAATVMASSKFCRLAVQILIMAAGAWLVLEQQLTGGAMIAASILLARALAPVDLVIAVSKQFVGARAAYCRLDECLNEPALRPGGLPLPTPCGALKLEDVGFDAANGRTILSGISFEVMAGETLAIVGPSGAGKSTLARLIIGISPPTIGHVRLDGADVFSWDREQLGRHVGYLPQEVPLFNATVAENIARLRPGDDPADVIEAARRANAHEMILRLPNGYDTPLGDGGVRLSGGQRQRIGLARAIYREPSLVLLDEPNANLDSEGDAALVRALLELKAQSTTIVFITHRPGLIAYADTLLLLRGGEPEMFGPRQYIMEQLKLRAVPPAAGPALSKKDNLMIGKRARR
jgi:PrtD family type I secretion system ABC transporter